MKLILCAVIWSAVAKSSANCFGVFPFLLITNPIRRIACFWDANTTYWKEVPTTREGLCLYECILDADGLLKEDGRIKYDKFMNLVKTELDDNELLAKVVKVMDVCKYRKHDSGDRCETVGVLLKCSVEEAKSFDLETNLILRLFYQKKGGWYEFLFN